MAEQRITDPQQEPLDLATVKRWLLVEDDEDNQAILDLIAAARDYAEHRTGRALMPQTWVLTLDQFPSYFRRYLNGQNWTPAPPQTYATHWKIELPHPPLIAVASVVYTDEAGDDQTLDPASYKVSTRTEPGQVTPAYGLTWPIARCEQDSVRITYQAGYADATKVPPGIKQAMRVLITARYEKRETEGVIEAVDRLLAQNWDGSYTAQQVG